MSVPLSLRLCCIAAMPMAPALTEAASRSSVTLPSSPPPASPDLPPPIVNGRDRTRHNELDTLKSENILPTTKLVSLTSHINFSTSQGGVLKQVCLGSKFRALDTPSFSRLGVVTNFPNAYKNARLEVLPGAKGTGDDGVKNLNGQNKMNTSKPSIMPPATVGKVMTGAPSAPLKLTVNRSAQGFVLQAISPVEKTPLTPGRELSNNQTICEDVEEKQENIDIDSSSNANNVDENLSNVELREQAKKSQHHLERRTQHLIRRLRRLQGRHLEHHAEQQLASFVAYQNQNLQTVAKSMKPLTNTTQERKPDLLQSRDVKNLSTAALVNLVRKLQSTQSAISLGQRILHSAKSAESSHSVLVLDEATRLESQRAADHIASNFRVAESPLDSDATESSSGGESCEECDSELDKEKKQKTPLHRRAEWKWATDRAAVASRWTWLQAQVSDLEYRIRQQSEIYRRIRESKGCVKLGDPLSPEDLTVKLRQVRSGRKPSPLETKIANLAQKNEMSPCNISTLLMNVNRQATKLTQSLGNCLTPVQNSLNTDQLKTQTTPNSLNGVISTSRVSTPSDAETESVDSVSIGPSGDACGISDIQPVDSTCQAARCLPVRTYRKRKLLRMAGLHQTSRKAARLSAVKCGCFPPVTSCPMCGGRYNNTQTVDPNTMPLHERISLLDPAFHPVLSFHHEIPLKIHFEALLRTGEWQHKPPSKATKSTTTQKRRQKLLVTERDLARKTSRKLAKQAVLFSSAKIRNKYDGKNGRKKRGTSLPNTPRKRTNNRKCHTELKRRRAAQLALAHLQRSNRSLSVALSGPMGIGNDSRTPTPSPQSKENGSLSSSCTSLALKEMREALRKRRGESAYDINNIVIPYSMAASTRVEKLKYKEIVTPKWRDVTLDPDKLVVDTPDEDTIERHPGETVELDVDKSDNSCLVQPVTEEDEEVEDLCDEIFIERHLKCEVQEKKRFMSHIHTNKRNRPKRVDGLSTSDSLSPDATFTSETRLTNINPTFSPVLSPLPVPVSTSAVTTAPLTVPIVSHPSTIIMPTTGKMHPPKEDLNRRRSSSVSSSRRSSTLDENSRESLGDTFTFRSPIYESWLPRIFPLTEDEYDDMLAVQPPASIIVPVCNAPITPQVPRTEILTPSSSHPCSPMPSTSSGSIIGEDPNDPEWTVIGDKVPPKQQLSVVLKLAKR